MADWNNPLITTQYDVFVAEAKARDVDAATLFFAAPTNPPTNAIRFNRATSKFEYWDAAAWQPLPISVAGGGTGAITAPLARAALGIGTMGTQDANAVAITAGTIIGLTQLEINASLTFTADGVGTIGTFAKKAKGAYFRDHCVLPVGVDKYATA